MISNALIPANNTYRLYGFTSQIPLNRPLMRGDEASILLLSIVPIWEMMLCLNVKPRYHISLQCAVFGFSLKLNTPYSSKWIQRSWAGNSSHNSCALLQVFRWRTQILWIQKSCSVNVLLKGIRILGRIIIIRLENGPVCDFNGCLPQLRWGLLTFPAP